MNSKDFRLAVFLSGRGSNFRAVWEFIQKNNLPIVTSVVVSDHADAAGIAFARERGIETAIVERRVKEQSKEKFNLALADAIKPFQPDLVVLAGFMRVLTAEFISQFRGKIINIHPSLLPNFRGLHAQKQALEAKVTQAGCTVHVVVEEVDAGPIIAQAVVPVFPGDTEETLSERILVKEHIILPAVVTALATKRVEIIPHGTTSTVTIHSREDFPASTDFIVG